jgi:hypothetical protein
VKRVRPSQATLDVVVERDQGRCASCGLLIVGERGRDWSLHHRRPAQMGGDRSPVSHGPANLLLLHGSGVELCHGHVESARTESYDLGLLVRRSDDPRAVAVEHAVHGLVLLDELGGWTPYREGDAA